VDNVLGKRVNVLGRTQNSKVDSLVYIQDKCIFLLGSKDKCDWNIKISRKVQLNSKIIGKMQLNFKICQIYAIEI